MFCCAFFWCNDSCVTRPSLSRIFLNFVQTQILTVFFYLNDVEAGGGTNFPLLDLVSEKPCLDTKSSFRPSVCAHISFLAKTYIDGATQAWSGVALAERFGRKSARGGLAHWARSPGGDAWSKVWCQCVVAPTRVSPRLLI